MRQLDFLETCCPALVSALEHDCDRHTAFACPETPIVKGKAGFGLSFHDGSSYLLISYCPFCGTKLPTAYDYGVIEDNG